MKIDNKYWKYLDVNNLYGWTMSQKLTAADLDELKTHLNLTIIS